MEDRMTGRGRTRGLVALVGLALLGAACGGGDDGVDDGAEAVTDAGAETSGADDAADPGTDGAETDGDDDAASDAVEEAAAEPAAAGRAVVTIDGQTYEFDPEASMVGRCDADFFGAFWVIAGLADGSSGGLEMLLVADGDPNHDETSRVTVDLEALTGRDWRADEDGGQGAAAGESRVESFTVDGTTATGTATFVDVYAGDGATTQGEFEVTCP
jgi:hypothetical protein